MRWMLSSGSWLAILTPIVTLAVGYTPALRGGFVLLTYDSCRYDVLIDADTPVLDSFGEVLRAQTPGNFTYAAHMAFFAGMLPNTSDDVPYYNRFRRQLIALTQVGELGVAKNAALRVSSSWNACASSSVWKVPPSAPQWAMVSATRLINCFTLDSRSAVPSLP